MKKVAIVIPIYKQELSKCEEISLSQAINVFRNYDKFFVKPSSLQWSYKNIINVVFKDKWFKSSKAYSRLLMNEEFYKCFNQYEYILIYQLDAFVFKDNLKYFCDLGYDYVGAPWLSGLVYYWNYKYNTLYVGNGGFSLRNVDKCIKLIRLKSTLFLEYINEDIFFSMGNSDIFRVAPVKVALEFSFEREVNRSFEMNEKKIPFGCHAWERYNLTFWKPYIEEHGFLIDETYIDKGNEDLILENEYKIRRADSSFWDMIYNTDKLRKFIKKQNKKIYIWGAGERGHFWGKLLKEAKINVEGYLDNNKNLIGKYIEGYKILTMDEFKRNVADSYVIITIDGCRNEIANQLEAMECIYGKDFVFYADVLQHLAKGEC